MGLQDWRYVVDERFRFGVGYESASTCARAKWNYYGAGFRLYAPKGPEYAKARVIVDGHPVEHIDLHAASVQPSQVVLEAALPVGYHAVAIVAEDAFIPCDCLEVDAP
jgi:hypothetical protein